MHHCNDAFFFSARLQNKPWKEVIIVSRKPNRTRTHEFKVMLNDEEMAILEMRANESRLSRSEYLRSWLTGKGIDGYQNGFVANTLLQTITERGDA